MAHAVEIERVDDVDQHLQAQVATDHAKGLAAGLRRGRHGDDQLVGRRILVGLGQRGPAGGHGILVPGALARVVAGRQLEARMHEEFAVGTPQVAEGKGRTERRLADQGFDLFGRVVARDGLRKALEQHQAAGQPVGDIVGGDHAHLVEIALQVRADGVALQVVVVKREQREGDDHDQRGGQQDLVAELELFGHLRNIRLAERGSHPAHGAFR